VDDPASSHDATAAFASDEHAAGGYRFGDDNDDSDSFVRIGFGGGGASLAATEPALPTGWAREWSSRANKTIFFSPKGVFTMKLLRR
jgi:hypothetical protein